MTGDSRRATCVIQPLIVLLLVAAGAISAGAHELGKTQVVATVAADGSYLVDVAVDPDALLIQLQLARDGQVAPPASIEARDRALANHATEFLAGVHLLFDGVPSAPAFAYLPPSRLAEAAQAAGTVRLTGHRPPGARTMKVRYDFAGGTFALVARVGDDAARTYWVAPSSLSEAIGLAVAPPPSTAAVARQYLGLGFTHILPKGLDHILFVIGLFLLSTQWRSVLTQISAFTIAHSLTLALTIYDIVALPARLVEPLIALSIAYVAVENLLVSELKSWRVALVFAFGLLHGMGFASVLHDLGLPRRDFLTALVTFNLGVEAGQLAVVGLALLVVSHWRSNQAIYSRWIVRPASGAIAAAGLFWTVQRLL